MKRIKLPLIQNISTMASEEANKIYYIDDIKGLLYKLDIADQNKIEIFNYIDSSEFKDITALTINNQSFFCSRSNILYEYKITNGKTYLASKHILDETRNITGITYKNSLYYIADKTGKIIVYDKKINKVKTWDIKREIDDITIHRHKNTNCLFILDSMSRAVYVYDLYGRHLFSITLPHEDATSIASVFSNNTNNYELYISYARKTWEIYDDTDPERCRGNYINIEMEKTTYNVFIKPLNYKIIEQSDNNAICLSNGYQIEFTYNSMLYPKSKILSNIKNIKPVVRMSIPTNTLRQKVVSIKPIGQIPGKIKRDETGEDIIEFDFTRISMDRETAIFGYKTVLNVYNIRYLIKNAYFPDKFDDNIKQFLAEEEKLDMHKKKLQDIAQNIISDMPERKKQNMLEVVKAIREYVYSKLEYKYNNRDTTPLETLKSGEGTCGKYTELLLGLMRLCNIPCRAVGDYKVPDYKLEWGILNTYTQPDYDHVWIEFFIPGIGWIPMESSSDDLPGKHNRFLAALPWIHIESSRTEKSKEVVIPETWEAIDSNYNFSDYFIYDISIKVIHSL